MEYRYSYRAPKTRKKPGKSIADPTDVGWENSNLNESWKEEVVA
jgi:hypothetical protein